MLPSQRQQLRKEVYMRSRLLKLVTVLGLIPAIAVLGTEAQASNFNPPKRYYLALGDSIAFGAQLGKFFQELSNGTYDPATFNTGYVDDFTVQLRSVHARSETVNLSCPAETTDSFTKSCLFKVLGFALHTNYSGSQE